MNKENIDYPKVAFLGCGHIAHVHMHFLSKLGIAVSCVCDTSETRARLLSEKYNIPRYYTDFDELIASEKPTVLHVLTPPHTHFDLVVKGLNAGCHIVVEKPLCFKKSEADMILKHAREKSLIVCVDYTRVYNPRIMKARDLIASGKFGRIVRMEYDYDDPILSDPGNSPFWVNKLNGGIFEDLLPHPLSVLLSFDSKLKIQHIFSKSNHDNNQVEELMIHLSSINVDALIKLSLNIKPLRNILYIYCQNGTIKIDLRNQYAVFLREKNMPNIISRVLNTASETWQMSTGFIGSIFGIITGKIHPYSGLDTILDTFYQGLKEVNSETPIAEDIVKVVDYTEQIVRDSITPIKFSPERKYQDRLAMKAECLVTGGTGFIGKALVKQLVKEGRRVRVFCRKDSSIGSLPENTALAFGDMRDPASLEKALQGIQTVFHCAAAMKGDWADFYESTVLGTENLLNAINKSDVETLIYVSSLGILNYNKMKNNFRLDESAPLENQPEKRGFYTHSKLLAEKQVRKFSEENKAVKTIIFRPGLVFGRESNKVLNNAGVLLGKFLFVFGLGKRYFGLNYIGNLIDALILLEKKGVMSGSIFHVVDPDQPTVSEYIKKHNSLEENKVFPFYMPIIIWKFAFITVDVLLKIKSGTKGTFAYKFASNSKKLDYRSDKLIKNNNWTPPYSFRHYL